MVLPRLNAEGVVNDGILIYVQVDKEEEGQIYTGAIDSGNGISSDRLTYT